MAKMMLPPGTTYWDAVSSLPGPQAAVGPSAGLAKGALEEAVAAIRGGKQMNPSGLSSLLKAIRQALGGSPVMNELQQIPNAGKLGLDPTLQSVIGGSGGGGGSAVQRLLAAGSGGASELPAIMQGGELAAQGGSSSLMQALGRGASPAASAGMKFAGSGSTVGAKAAQSGASGLLPQASAAAGKGGTSALDWLKRIAMAGGGVALGYGLTQPGDPEGTLPPGAGLLMRSNTVGSKPTAPRKRVGPKMPQLPGVTDSLPEELGESFDAPSEEETEIPTQLLQGRNPAQGMDSFFPNGQMTNTQELMGFRGGQQFAPRKKSLLQALMGGIDKVF